MIEIAWGTVKISMANRDYTCAALSGYQENTLLREREGQRTLFSSKARYQNAVNRVIWQFHAMFSGNPLWGVSSLFKLRCTREIHKTTIQSAAS
jgi:hypothetical protein